MRRSAEENQTKVRNSGRDPSGSIRRSHSVGAHVAAPVHKRLRAISAGTLPMKEADMLARSANRILVRLDFETAASRLWLATSEM